MVDCKRKTNRTQERGIFFPRTGSSMEIYYANEITLCYVTLTEFCYVPEMTVCSMELCDITLRELTLHHR